MLMHRPQGTSIRLGSVTLKKFTALFEILDPRLDPLLFLIYINDLFNASHKLSFIVFADDSKIFFRHKNINTLQNILNK